jgi:hypothetical protein
MRRLCIALVATGVLGFAAGQALTKDEPAGDPMAAWIETHMPGKAQEVMKGLEGTWNAKTTMWMDPAAPPMSMDCVCENVMLFEGRYLEQYFGGEMMGKPFEGRGLMAHDNDKKVWQMTWIDSWSSSIAVLEGPSTADLKTIVMTGTEKNPMGVFDVRWTMKVESADRYVSMREVRPQGATTPWQKDMEIVYTRVTDEPMDVELPEDEGGDDMGGE